MSDEIPIGPGNPTGGYGLNDLRSLPSSTGSAASLSTEQRDILYHTEHRAAGGLYCGGGKDMNALVAAGLMESAGRKSFVPDEYFRITGAGRRALRQAECSHKFIDSNHCLKCGWVPPNADFRDPPK
jgi:hypothetical protein